MSILTLILEKFTQFYAYIGAHHQIYEVYNQHLSEAAAFDILQSNFTLAFAVKDNLNDNFKYDRTKVEWIVHIYEG